MATLSEPPRPAWPEPVGNPPTPEAIGKQGLDDLARHDQPTQYFPAIDGLRGILAISTIFMHVNRDWFTGAPAVMDIFFVISGFLITLLLLRNIQRHGHINLKSFWIRRIKRLYPLLILVVGTYLLLASILISKPAPLYADGVESLLYVSNWTKLYNYIYPTIFGHTWSLSIEEQFYLLWPLWLSAMLHWGFSRKSMIVSCLVLVAITIIWRNYLIDVGEPWSRIYFASDTRVDGFLLGGILAMAWQRWQTCWYQLFWMRFVSQACAAGLVVAVVFWNPWQVQYFAWHQSMVILLTCGMVIALASPMTNSAKCLLSLRPLRQLGLMCYGIYLWHWPMVWLLLVTLHLEPLVVLCLVLPTTLVLAYLSYRYVEAPILSRRAKAA